ncbi:hypothetical protein K505DRAFT_329409 [Melanomma pulvis-pyrius CBS 109.77]|uniref:Uncharacterized protein n=1 Tax=Melanomma pulvis-pyrius CBS 109.77 TaxID=1314802 RepID=A0A6A6WUN2_9PLEO|nr:hypothetical protein K505DRAFT_329409 [Melanomma pulvis-pyrius CBS 109.77]
MLWKYIVAGSAILGFSFAFIMVLITRLLWVHKSSKNIDTLSADDETTEQQNSSVFAPDRLWARIFTSKREKGHLVPTMSGIIKAGDEGVYSSALFNGLHGHPRDLSLELLYAAFGHELKNRSAMERSSYPIPISKLLPTTRQPVRRGQSFRVTKEGRYEFQPRTQRSSLDLVERGLGRSRSRRTAPVLLSMFDVLAKETKGTQTATSKWANDLQHAKYLDEKTGVTVTGAELAALSVILGSPALFSQATKTDKSIPLYGKGAFSISVSGALMEDGRYQISLTQHKRGISHLPARGSGYCTLFAKHMACGSLPYSQDQTNVYSIFITVEALEAIRSGTSVSLQKSDSQTPTSRFLTSLPSSRTPAFHTLTPVFTYTPTEPPTLLFNAIASLPFTGGLTPLASTPLIQTIQFISSAGLPTGRLLQRLDALVEKVHRHSPGLHLFGPLYEPGNAGLLFRERERLGRLAVEGNGSVEDSVADKAARVQRFITLLERLMCLVPGMKPHDVLTAVKEATKTEMERSYENAVAAFKNGDLDQGAAVELNSRKRHSTLSSRTRRSKRSSSASFTPPTSTAAVPLSPLSLQQQSTPPTPSSPSLTSSRESTTFPTHNLGRQAEQILKLSLPLDVQSIATVVRLVVAAWTASVESADAEHLQFGAEEKMVLW